MSHVTRNIHVQISVWTCFQFSWRYIYINLRMELLGHSNSMFNTWEIPRLFYKAAPPFYNPATGIESCTCSTPLPTLDMVSLLRDTVIPVGVKWQLSGVLICISLMINDFWAFFMCLLVNCPPYLEKCLLKSSSIFKLGCLLFNIHSWYKPLIKHTICKYFLHSIGCLFTVLMLPFEVLFFSLVTCAFPVVPMLCLAQVHKDLLLFSFKNFVLALLFMSMRYLH